MNKKRVFAWILLIGFILLMINILFIGYYRLISGYIYLILVIAFFISKAFVRNTYIDDNEDKNQEDNK